MPTHCLGGRFTNKTLYDNEGLPAMKSINRWDNVFARRLAVLAALPVTIPAVILFGAWFGIVEAVKEMVDAMQHAWNGVR